MKNPQISLLTTVYNRAAFLAETMKSVQRSSFTDWELVVVDDCSADESVDIAQSFAVDDDRIKVYTNEKNLGDYMNRNRAASFANGKYIKYLDADDILYPYSLQIMFEAMEQFPNAGLGLSFHVVDDVQPFPQLVSSREAYRSFFLGRNILRCGPSASIIRRALFEEIGGFSGRQYVGDTELWLKLAAAASVVKLQPALVWWRQHDGQQMAFEKADPNVLGTRHKIRMQFLENAGNLLTQDERHEARQRELRRHAHDIWRLILRKRQLTAAVNLYRNSGLKLHNMARGLAGRPKKSKPKQSKGQPQLM